MSKERVIIDMDHVMADITSQYIKWYENATGVSVNKDDLLGKPEDLAFPQPGLVRSFLLSPGFFRDVSPIEGSQEVVKELNSQYEVFIVSAAMEFPQSLIEKHDWLLEHFPFISWRQIVFCGSKGIITGDYMIDDHLKNLEHFEGKKILFTATHNIHVDGYTRANNWREVSDLLLGKKTGNTHQGLTSTGSK